MLAVLVLGVWWATHLRNGPDAPGVAPAAAGGPLPAASQPAAPPDEAAAFNLPGLPALLEQDRREHRQWVEQVRAQGGPRRRGPLPRRVPAGQDPDPAWTATSGLDGQAGPLHVLVLGTDQEGFRSDVLMLVRVEPARGRVAVLNLPRDTLAPIAGGGGHLPRWDKLAHASAWSDRQYTGTERARRTVEQLLGVRVHRVVRVSMTAFVELVDALGGVEVEVPFPMHYEDPWQNLSIHLEPGRQRLSGAETLHLARWRQDNTGRGYGDLGRIQTQRQILLALLGEVRRQPGTVLAQVPNMLRQVKTDLRIPAEVTALVLFAARLDAEQIEWYTLPGTPGEPGTPAFGYYLVDEARLDATVAAWRGRQPACCAPGPAG